MEKNKIFIALEHYNSPNPIALYGVHLAKKLNRTAFLFGSEKIPVYPQTTSVTGFGYPEFHGLSMKSIREYAEIEINRLCLELKKFYEKVEGAVEIGFPEREIISKTEDELPFLALLQGNNDLTNLHEWFGTYETRLAENIEAPVLVMPKGQVWEPINRILYLMDLDDHKAENMRFLSMISKELDAHLDVVVISEDRSKENEKVYDFTINTLKGFLGYTKTSFHHIFTEESAENVDRLITGLNVDWLAFEHKSRSFLARIFDDYNTKRLILQSEIPVLVF